MSKKGACLTEEHKKKIGEALRGRPGTNLGKKFSAEWRQKISESLKGQIISEERRRKQSIAMKGKPGPNKGKTFSEDHRRKLGLSHKGKCAGEKCYLWKGGISFEPYCVKFNNEFKERVRAFFNYSCIECGTPQNGERLHVHHVDFNKQSCCDKSIPLFVALCRKCHTKTNHKREYWKSHFTNIIEKYYQGKCYLTKEEMFSLKRTL